MLKKINLAINWAGDLSDVDQNGDSSDTIKNDLISINAQQKLLLQKIKSEFENLLSVKQGSTKEEGQDHKYRSQNNDDIAQEVQSIIYNNAKSDDFQPKEVFKLFYQILIQAERGPRLGNYIADLGLDNVIKTLDNIIS